MVTPLVYLCADSSSLRSRNRGMLFVESATVDMVLWHDGLEAIARPETRSRCRLNVDSIVVRTNIC